MINLKIINQDEIFERIKTGYPFDKQLNPYTKTEIELVIQHLIKDEEYEKCQFLKEFIEKKFDHSKNYKSSFIF